MHLAMMRGVTLFVHHYLDRPPQGAYTEGMETLLTYTYWEDGPCFVGYLNERPDDST
jgi:hypothetical protein